MKFRSFCISMRAKIPALPLYNLALKFVTQQLGFEFFRAVSLFDSGELALKTHYSALL